MSAKNHTKAAKRAAIIIVPVALISLIAALGSTLVTSSISASTTNFSADLSTLGSQLSGLSLLVNKDPVNTSVQAELIKRQLQTLLNGNVSYDKLDYNLDKNASFDTYYEYKLNYKDQIDNHFDLTSLLNSTAYTTLITDYYHNRATSDEQLKNLIIDNTNDNDLKRLLSGSDSNYLYTTALRLALLKNSPFDTTLYKSQNESLLTYLLDNLTKLINGDTTALQQFNKLAGKAGEITLAALESWKAQFTNFQFHIPLLAISRFKLLVSPTDLQMGQDNNLHTRLFTSLSHATFVYDKTTSSLTAYNNANVPIAQIELTPGSLASLSGYKYDLKDYQKWMPTSALLETIKAGENGFAAYFRDDTTLPSQINTPEQKPTVATTDEQVASALLWQNELGNNLEDLTSLFNAGSWAWYVGIRDTNKSYPSGFDGELSVNTGVGFGAGLSRGYDKLNSNEILKNFASKDWKDNVVFYLIQDYNGQIDPSTAVQISPKVYQWDSNHNALAIPQGNTQSISEKKILNFNKDNSGNNYNLSQEQTEKFRQALGLDKLAIIQKISPINKKLLKYLIASFNARLNTTGIARATNVNINSFSQILKNQNYLLVNIAQDEPNLNDLSHAFNLPFDPQHATLLPWLSSYQQYRQTYFASASKDLLNNKWYQAKISAINPKGNIVRQSGRLSYLYQVLVDKKYFYDPNYLIAARLATPRFSTNYRNPNLSGNSDSFTSSFSNAIKYFGDSNRVYTNNLRANKNYSGNWQSQQIFHTSSDFVITGDSVETYLVDLSRNFNSRDYNIDRSSISQKSSPNWKQVLVQDKEINILLNRYRGVTLCYQNDNSCISAAKAANQNYLTIYLPNWQNYLSQQRSSADFVKRVPNNWSQYNQQYLNDYSGGLSITYHSQAARLNYLEVTARNGNKIAPRYNWAHAYSWKSSQLDTKFQIDNDYGKKVPPNILTNYSYFLNSLASLPIYKPATNYASSTIKSYLSSWFVANPNLTVNQLLNKIRSTLTTNSNINQVALSATEASRQVPYNYQTYEYNRVKVAKTRQVWNANLTTTVPRQYQGQFYYEFDEGDLDTYESNHKRLFQLAYNQLTNPSDWHQNNCYGGDCSNKNPYISSSWFSLTPTSSYSNFDDWYRYASGLYEFAISNQRYKFTYYWKVWPPGWVYKDSANITIYRKAHTDRTGGYENQTYYDWETRRQEVTKTAYRSQTYKQWPFRQNHYNIQFNSTRANLSILDWIAYFDNFDFARDFSLNTQIYKHNYNLASGSIAPKNQSKAIMATKRINELQLTPMYIFAGTDNRQYSVERQYNSNYLSQIQGWSVSDELSQTISTANNNLASGLSKGQNALFDYLNSITTAVAKRLAKTHTSDPVKSVKPIIPGNYVDTYTNVSSILDNNATIKNFAISLNKVLASQTGNSELALFNALDTFLARTHKFTITKPFARPYDKGLNWDLFANNFKDLFQKTFFTGKSELLLKVDGQDQNKNNLSYLYNFVKQHHLDNTKGLLYNDGVYAFDKVADNNDGLIFKQNYNLQLLFTDFNFDSIAAYLSPLDDKIEFYYSALDNLAKHNKNIKFEDLFVKGVYTDQNKQQFNKLIVEPFKVYLEWVGQFPEIKLDYQWYYKWWNLFFTALASYQNKDNYFAPVPTDFGKQNHYFWYNKAISRLASLNWDLDLDADTTTGVANLPNLTFVDGKDNYLKLQEQLQNLPGASLDNFSSWRYDSLLDNLKDNWAQNDTNWHFSIINFDYKLNPDAIVHDKITDLNYLGINSHNSQGINMAGSPYLFYDSPLDIFKSLKNADGTNNQDIKVILANFVNAYMPNSGRQLTPEQQDQNLLGFVPTTKSVATINLKKLVDTQKMLQFILKTNWGDILFTIFKNERDKWQLFIGDPRQASLNLADYIARLDSATGIKDAAGEKTLSDYHLNVNFSNSAGDKILRATLASDNGLYASKGELVDNATSAANSSVELNYQELIWTDNNNQKVFRFAPDINFSTEQELSSFSGGGLYGNGRAAALFNNLPVYQSINQSLFQIVTTIVNGNKTASTSHLALSSYPWQNRSQIQTWLDSAKNLTASDALGLLTSSNLAIFERLWAAYAYLFNGNVPKSVYELALANSQKPLSEVISYAAGLIYDNIATFNNFVVAFENKTNLSSGTSYAFLTNLINSLAPRSGYSQNLVFFFKSTQLPPQIRFNNGTLVDSSNTVVDIANINATIAKAASLINTSQKSFAIAYLRALVNHLRALFKLPPLSVSTIEIATWNSARQALANLKHYEGQIEGGNRRAGFGSFILLDNMTIADYNGVVNYLPGRSVRQGELNNYDFKRDNLGKQTYNSTPRRDFDIATFSPSTPYQNGLASQTLVVAPETNSNSNFAYKIDKTVVKSKDLVTIETLKNKLLSILTDSNFDPQTAYQDKTFIFLLKTSLYLFSKASKQNISQTQLNRLDKLLNSYQLNLAAFVAHKSQLEDKLVKEFGPELQQGNILTTNSNYQLSINGVLSYRLVSIGYQTDSNYADLAKALNDYLITQLRSNNVSSDNWMYLVYLIAYYENIFLPQISPLTPIFNYRGDAENANKEILDSERKRLYELAGQKDLGTKLVNVFATTGVLEQGLNDLETGKLASLNQIRTVVDKINSSALNFGFSAIAKSVLDDITMQAVVDNLTKVKTILDQILKNANSEQKKALANILRYNEVVDNLTDLNGKLGFGYKVLRYIQNASGNLIHSINYLFGALFTSVDSEHNSGLYAIVAYDKSIIDNSLPYFDMLGFNGKVVTGIRVTLYNLATDNYFTLVLPVEPGLHLNLQSLNADNTKDLNLPNKGQTNFWKTVNKFSDWKKTNDKEHYEHIATVYENIRYGTIAQHKSRLFTREQAKI